MRQALCLIVSLAALTAATSAWSDEAIPTANDGSSTGAPAETASPPPLDDAASAPADDDIVRIGPCGAVQRASDKGPIDKQAHGQVEVGVGTGGYRHIGGVVCKPIGENGAITIAVDHTEWGGAGRRHFAQADTPPLAGADAQTSGEGMHSPSPPPR